MSKKQSNPPPSGKRPPPPSPPAGSPAPIVMDPADQVVAFLIEGHSNQNIIEYLETNDLTPEAARAIFEDALKKFVKAANLPKTVRRGWCLEAYRDLYRRLVSTGDYAGALRAVQEIAKLADVMPKPEDAGKTDDEKIKDELDDYIEKVMML